MIRRVLILLAITALSTYTFAYDICVGGVYYNLIQKAKQATVTNGDNKYQGDITIPPTITVEGVEYSVTSIGDNAFEQCVQLTSLNIPNTVTSIGQGAFKYCSMLTSLRIPDSVITLGGYAFGFCDSLQSVSIGNSVKSIEGKTFFYCTSLRSLYIGKSVQKIEKNAFENCNKLSSIYIDDLAAWCNIEFVVYGNLNPLRISHNLFLKGELIVDLEIPNTVTSINDRAFYNCTSIVSVKIPHSVQSIGISAFADCSSLKSVSIPSTVTYLGGGCFSGCSSLESISIPSSVTNLEAWCFSGCSSLESISIPSSVTNLDNWCFSGCTSLKTISIPSSVTNLGQSCFENCSFLSSINIPSSVKEIGESCFAGCSALTSASIPKTLEIIKRATFKGCSMLKGITLGTWIKEIGSLAFASCKELSNIYCFASTPPSVDSNTFQDSYIDYATLYIPKESMAKYQGTDVWKDFGAFKSLSGEDVEVKQCTIPGIQYSNGKLTLTCETEGAVINYEVTAMGNMAGNMKPGIIELNNTYEIKAYAVADGMKPSATITKEIKLETVKTVEMHDTIYIYDDTYANIILPTGNTILFYVRNGSIIIEDAPISELVSIYTISGEIYEQRRVTGKTLTLEVPRNNIYIIRIGEHSIKVKI